MVTTSEIDNRMSVAVIGAGFVGGSLAQVFAERGLVVYNYDITGKRAVGTKVLRDPENPFASLPTFEEVAEQYERRDVWKNDAGEACTGIYFLCLPTPMSPDGSADLSIVEPMLEKLAALPPLSNGEPRIAVIKSTVPPGTCKGWDDRFANKGLRVVFNPEFLREATALDDMRNQDRIVLGGPRPHINRVKQLFNNTFPNVKVIKTNSTTAEMVKYFINIQLAARVALSVEFYQICNALDAKGLDIDYDKVKEYACEDKRLGGSHMSVPGLNGQLSFGLTCFPKDICALISASDKIGYNAKLMKAIWSRNLEYTPEGQRDWEKMSGRAVSAPKTTEEERVT